MLRIQTGDARQSDVYIVLRELLENDEFRSQRMEAIAALTDELDITERQETCRAMASMLFTDYQPKAGAAVGSMHQTTPHFAVHCAPPPKGVWANAGHLEGKYNTKAKIDSVRVSSYVRELLVALERMWNVHGHLVK